jgi:flap endonuclease-1
MGINLRDLTESEPIELSSLKGKIIAIDAFNILYQFLASMRQADGTPLTNSRGMITSHLSGILYRISTLMNEGIMPVLVFDGIADIKKKSTQDTRRTSRETAAQDWAQALEEGDLEKARTKASQSIRLTSDQISEAKELLSYMGVPIIEAPGEGEAQCSHMARMGTVHAAASQDYDCLLFGAPLLLRNFTTSGRRKNPHTKLYDEVKTELMTLSNILTKNNLTREQLVDMALMIGTDFNPGVKGIGPKKALKLILEHKTLEASLTSKNIEIPLDAAYLKNIFLHPNVTDNYTLTFNPPNEEMIFRFMVNDRDFNKDKVMNAIRKMIDRAKPPKVEMPGKQISFDDLLGI